MPAGILAHPLEVADAFLPGQLEVDPRQFLAERPDVVITLDLAQGGNGDRGQTVSVEVTPDDGTATGASATDSAVVANSAPVLSAVSIDQAAPRTNDTLTFSFTATDADGDSLTPVRQWRRNGGDLAGETGAALDLSAAGNGDRGDQLTMRLSVSDGTASSATPRPSARAPWSSADA